MSGKDIKFWADVSDKYDSAVDMILGKNIRHKIMEKLKEEDGMGKLLELGCGTGYFTPTLAGKSETVTATDISKEMLEIARERFKNHEKIEFQTMDCQNITFDKETFDTVFMGLVLLFAEDPEMALNESHRVLKQGGSLFVADPDVSFLSNYGKLRFLLRTLKNYHKIPPTSQFFTQKELFDILDKTGFNVVDIEIIRDNSDQYSVSANYIKANIK